MPKKLRTNVQDILEQFKFDTRSKGVYSTSGHMEEMGRQDSAGALKGLHDCGSSKLGAELGSGNDESEAFEYLDGELDDLLDDSQKSEGGDPHDARRKVHGRSDDEMNGFIEEEAMLNALSSEPHENTIVPEEDGKSVLDRLNGPLKLGF